MIATELGAPKRKLWLFSAILILIPLIFEVSLIALLYWQIDSYKTQLRSLQDELNVTNHVGSLSDSIRDSYYLLLIYSASKSDFALERLNNSITAVQREFNTIHDLRRSRTDKSLRQLEKGLLPILTQMGKVKEEIARTEEAESLPIVFTEINLASNLAQTSLDSFKQKQIQLQRIYEKDRENSKRRLEATLFVGLLVNVAIAFGFALLIGRYINRRLDVVVQNAMRLSRRETLSEALTGNDEISHLDKTFRLMANLLLQAERRERDMIDNSTDVICSIDQNGTIIEISPAITQLTGSDPESLRGKRFVALATERTREATFAQLSQSREDMQQFSVENQVSVADGTTKDILWSGKWNAQSKTHFIVGHDVTERKRAERLKQDVIAMVSHDIRSPLMTIDASLELIDQLAGPNLDERAKSVLKRAHIAGEHVLTLAQDLLELDKIDSGMLELFVEEVDAQQLITKAAELVSGPALEKRVEIVTQGHPSICICDQRRITQVLFNLLSNAIKFTPENGGKIVVSQRLAEDGHIFSVEDNGKGIPEDLLPYVFDRYRQVHKEGAGRVGGTGLGLAICMALVELHGGRIWVESLEGKGARFNFSIPE